MPISEQDTSTTALANWSYNVVESGLNCRMPYVAKHLTASSNSMGLTSAVIHSDTNKAFHEWLLAKRKATIF